MSVNGKDGHPIRKKRRLMHAWIMERVCYVRYIWVSISIDFNVKDERFLRKCFNREASSHKDKWIEPCNKIDPRKELGYTKLYVNSEMPDQCC